MKISHWIGLALLTGIAVAAQLMGEPGHGAWARVPGFWSFFGFVGCVLIIVVSKAIGKYILQRREDYYDEP